MAGARAGAILAAMDRSLNADDFRLLDTLARATSTPAAEAPPELAALPGWFQRLVRQQCAQFGIVLPTRAPAAERAA